MADREPISLSSMFEPYCRHDPVTHKIHCYLRRRHDIIRSPRLEAFDRCMHSELEGHHYRGHGAREDSILVREAFSHAAHDCHRKTMGYPSDRRR